MQSYFNVKNEFGLSGENLEYYQDIEYLKELTKQATALMSRSNAVYNNILNDFEVGHELRGYSPSITNRSKSAEDGLCDLCGLAHGADYCILKQILSEEQPKDYKSECAIYKRSLSKSTFMASKRYTSWTMDESRESNEGSLMPGKTEKSVKLPIFEKLSPEKLLKSYAMVCARYGDSNGRRFLLANTLANKSDDKIEPWTAPCDSRTEKIAKMPPKRTYPSTERDCFSEPTQFNPLCTDYSDQVLKKVEQLVVLRPPCEAQAFETRKNWKGIFKKYEPDEKEDAPKKSDSTMGSSMPRSVLPVLSPGCRCGIEDCDCVEDLSCMSPPRYECEKDSNIETNHLITVRNRMERRRYVKNVRPTTMTSRDTQTIDKKSRKSSIFFNKSIEEQEQFLRDCLTYSMNDRRLLLNDETFLENVEHIADLSSPTKMIDEATWQNFIIAHDRKDAMYNSDEISCSGHSGIVSEKSGLTEHSLESDIDYKDEKLFQTRIPLAEEAYRLTNILFDKISRKFEKSIHKNTFRVDRLWYRPTFAHLMRTIKMLETMNKTFYDIGQNMNYFENYSKRLTPLSVRKQSKLNRLEAMARKVRKVDSRRKWSQGIQTGKQYRRFDKAVKYTREGHLKGFSELRRDYLEKPESHRIKSYNLVGDDRGRSITKKTIYNDFRLIRNLFEDDSECRRNSLMDEDMKIRLEKYRRRIRGFNEDSLPSPPEPISKVDDTTSQESFGMVGQSVPKKEEVGVEQSSPATWKFSQWGQRKTDSFINIPIVSSSNVPKAIIRATSVGNDKLKNQDSSLLPKVGERKKARRMACTKLRNLLACPSESLKQKKSDSVGYFNRASTEVAESESIGITERKTHPARRKNQLIGNGKESSGSSAVRSFQDKYGRDKSETNFVESQGCKGSQISMYSKGKPIRPSMKKGLASLDALPPIRTLFDERILPKEPQSKRAVRISGSARNGKSAVFS